MRFAPEIGESLTLVFAEAAAARRRDGLPILSLGLGEPDFATPQPLIEAVSEVLAEGNSRYSSPLGVPGLREAIADKLGRENGINVTPGAVLVTAGAKQALSLVLMAMLEPGDEIIIVSPSFVSFVPQVLIAEPDCTVRIVGVDRDTHQLDPERLASAFSARTRAVLINSPNNPTGSQLDRESLQGVLDLAREHDAYVISDEVYEKLVFGAEPHISIGALESEPARVVTINGFSKSHAMTGWRVGYAAVPAPLLPRLTKIQQHMNTNTCTFVQQALQRAWDPACPHLDDYRATLATRAALMDAWVRDTPAVSCRVPSAGFFAFIDIAALGCSSNDFCSSLLLETGVATTPGIAFGKDWDDHVRVSFAVPRETLVEALEHMRDFIGRDSIGSAGQ